MSPALARVKRGGLQTYLRPRCWDPRGSRAMTESARQEGNRCNGLEGHNCSRLSRRRSDLFHHHALCVWQFLGERFDPFECVRGVRRLSSSGRRVVRDSRPPTRSGRACWLRPPRPCCARESLPACSPTPAGGLAVVCARERARSAPHE